MAGADIKALPLNGFAPSNADIAAHLRDQADMVESGQFGDMRNIFMVYEDATGQIKRQICGSPCDRARMIGVLTMACAQAAIDG